MYSHGMIHTEFLPDQAELSRQAERRFVLSTALRQRPRRVRRPSPTRRVRHALAGRLIATARLIDAT